MRVSHGRGEKLGTLTSIVRAGTLPVAVSLVVVSCGSSGVGGPTFRFDAGAPFDAGSFHFDAGSFHLDAGGGTGTGTGTGTGVGTGTGTGPGTGHDSGTHGVDSGMTESPDAGLGTAITCSAPGNYTKNGGSCGTERWSIKTGTDSAAAGLSLVPTLTTIAALDALPAAGGGNSRESPTEDTLFELRDVTLTEIKIESDSDYHLVVSDGTHTMIVEIPYPTCATGSPWACFMGRSRSEVDSMFTVSSSPQNPGRVITVRGFGFFDVLHGQTGVAPNGIELHPVLQICFGQGCTPS